ncbi:hypothetical protein QE152_g21794 [Popillia japonica]|uniref:Uncharacterized protein n=1 Tax=Popillia japonica TaxID=7064 RepID=A0AAW1KMY4_POPJA
MKIPSTYHLITTENVEEYIKFLELPTDDDTIAAFKNTKFILNIQRSMKVSPRGFRLSIPVAGQEHIIDFIPGLAFEETFPNGFKFKTTAIKEGNRFILMSQGRGIKFTRNLDFSKDGAEMTIEGTNIKQIFERSPSSLELHLPQNR